MPKRISIEYRGTVYPSVAELYRELSPVDFTLMEFRRRLRRGLSVDEALRVRPMSKSEAGRKAKALHRKNKNPMWT